MSSNKLAVLNEIYTAVLENAEVCEEMTQEATEFEGLLDVPHWDAIKMRTRELEKLYHSAGKYIQQAVESEAKKVIKPSPTASSYYHELGVSLLDMLEEQNNEAIAAGESRTLTINFRLNTAADLEDTEEDEKPVTLH